MIFLKSALAIVCVPVLYLGLERLISDKATRVRYALRNAALLMRVRGESVRTVHLNPNTWPGSCASGSRYQLTLSPYKGNKAVPAADIRIECDGGRSPSWAGTRLIVPREMRVDKASDEEVRISLQRGSSDIEVIAIE